MSRTIVSPRELESSLKIAYLYFSGRKQLEIAKQLGITTSTVSRALSKARQFIEFKYSVPGDEQLEAQLLLRFQLRDAVAVETGGVDHSKAIVGQAAARYFTLNVNSGNKVSLSCGETLLEMVKGLPSQLPASLKLCQLSIEGDPKAIHQAPATLIGLLRSKLSSGSAATGIQLPPSGTVADDARFRKNIRESALLTGIRKEAMASDFAFIGTAGVDKGEVLARSFFSISDQQMVKGLKQGIQKLRIVGEINNRLFDEKGVDRTDEIPYFNEYFISVLTLDDLRLMVKRGTRVVLVATGAKKLDAIRVALNNGLANVLITDRDLALRLLSN